MFIIIFFTGKRQENKENVGHREKSFNWAHILNLRQFKFAANKLYVVFFLTAISLSIPTELPWYFELYYMFILSLHNTLCSKSACLKLSLANFDPFFIMKTYKSKIYSQCIN